MKRLLGLVLAAALLAGCGAGETGGILEKPASGTPTLVIGTHGASAAAVLYAVEIIVRLPAGVTVPADPVTGEMASELVRVEGKGKLSGGHFFPATATTPARLKLQVADPGGFTVGNLASVSCQSAPGSVASGADFGIEAFSARGADAAELPGISPYLTFQMQ